MLDDSGRVGVRAVVEGVVQFMPIKIVSDGPDGMWVSGLPDRVNVITVGQEFVSQRPTRQAVPDKSGKSS